MATNWEYRVAQATNSASVKDLTTFLDGFGSEGWELVGVYASPGNPTAYYFKRPIAAQAAAQSNFGR